MKLLVVDDDQDIRVALEEALKLCGHEVRVADSGEMALTMMRRSTPDILLTDLYMDGISGLELLNKTNEYFPTVTPVLMTARASIDTAVSSIRQGAYDYLLKPLDLEQLEQLFLRIEKLRFQRENQETLHLEGGVGQSVIATKNRRMEKILEMAGKVATTDSTVLITGESGTGKTMLARMIHDGSVRAKGPFAVVNCATLSENLLESELFGHARGSFTGAIREKIGRLQVADTGTVFLDEIGEISPTLQTKLLRFLQEREFEKVGDTKTIRVDVRIIAATNQELERQVREGKFREDLYFRLNVIELPMPSLRHRPEDVPGLAEEFLKQAFALTGRPPRPLGPEARRAVNSYGWPGNIRELKNAMERASILCSADQIQLEDLPERVYERRELNTGEEYAAQGFEKRPSVTVVPLSTLGSLANLGNLASLANPPNLSEMADFGGEESPAAAPEEKTESSLSFALAGAGSGHPLGSADSTSSDGSTNKMSLDELERIHIQRVLATAESLEKAALTLGINLSTLWRKRRQYGMN